MADEETLAAFQQQVQQVQQQLQAQQQVIQNQEQLLRKQQQCNENEALSSDNRAPPHLGHAPQNFAQVALPSWAPVFLRPPPTRTERPPPFLGMFNFYTRFVPKAATYQAPLYDALAGQRGNHPVTWTPALTQAFGDCKTALWNATLLSHSKPEAPLGLFTGASSTAVGASLMQRVGNTWCPLAFFSKKHSSPKPPPPSSSIGDATSPPAETTWPAYYRELLAIYEAVQHFRHILEAHLFNQLHNLSHLDIRASTRLVTDRYAWPSMQQDCLTWARTCIQCQRAQITLHVTSSLGEFPLPTEQFQHVHTDIIGPLPPAGPYRYCLTAIDRYTRWPEVGPLERINAEDVTSAFFSGWVARFSTPRRVTTDQGTLFESELFRLLGLSTGFERSRTTSYHPCANGMIEWFHRQFKAAIMCHPHSTWLEALPAVAPGLRATFKSDIQATPAEFVYGEPLRLPGELLSAPTSDVTSSDPADFVT
ncbi:uncharacterized protein LOC119173628 [Rhipicephalus microplus]|uniref:uncharacterized protein LOC119173628 n=1 Tax=Rhipicephalus microplus TaxID=6941 RepID=UPI003F6D97FB